MDNSTQIHFFELNGLLKKLSERALTSREAFLYLIYEYLLVTSFNIVDMFGVQSAKSPGGMAAIFGALIAILVILPICFLIFQAIYRANGGDGGKDFLGRLLAVGFVATCRTTVFLLPLLILLKIGGTSAFAMPLAIGAILGAIVAMVYVPYTLYSSLAEIKRLEGIG